MPSIINRESQLHLLPHVEVQGCYHFCFIFERSLARILLEGQLQAHVSTQRICIGFLGTSMLILKQYIKDTFSLSFLLLPLWSIGYPWTALFHVSILILRQSAGLLLRGNSPSHGRYLYKHGINTNIHALNGIQIHDPSVRVGEPVYVLDRAATVVGTWKELQLTNGQNYQLL
jgi:hypothetical protein